MTDKKNKRIIWEHTVYSYSDGDNTSHSEWEFIQLLLPRLEKQGWQICATFFNPQGEEITVYLKREKIKGEKRNDPSW
jgi:hypothetical protein